MRRASVGRGSGAALRWFNHEYPTSIRCHNGGCAAGGLVCVGFNRTRTRSFFSPFFRPCARRGRAALVFLMFKALGRVDRGKAKTWAHRVANKLVLVFLLKSRCRRAPAGAGSAQKMDMDEKRGTASDYCQDWFHDRRTQVYTLIGASRIRGHCPGRGSRLTLCNHQCATDRCISGGSSSRRRH